MTLDKDFEYKIATEGIVDTPNYRYVYRSYPDEPCIERIEKKYLGTVTEEEETFDCWEWEEYGKQCGDPDHLLLVFPESWV